MQKPPGAGIEKPGIMLGDDCSKLGNHQSRLPGGSLALRLFRQAGSQQPVLDRLRHVAADSELVSNVRIVERARVVDE